MAKPNLLLHIGAEKTGTSSIQSFLLVNRKALSEVGVYYLHSPGRADCRSLPVLCIGQNTPDDFLRMEGIKTPAARSKFVEETQQWLRQQLTGAGEKCHTIVISSEHLSSRLSSVEAVQRVKELLQPHVTEIRIVCYFRNQAESLPSSYSTYVLSGGTESLARFRKRFLKGASNDLNAMISRWERVFGKDNIEARIYSRRRFSGEDLLREFSGFLHGVPQEKLHFGVPLRNRSLSRRGMRLARAINIVVPRFDAEDNESEINRRLVRSVARLCQGEPLRLNTHQREEVLQHFRESNSKLKARYFPDESFP